jgi:hypothetical protein
MRYKAEYTQYGTEYMLNMTVIRKGEKLCTPKYVYVNYGCHLTWLAD